MADDRLILETQVVGTGKVSSEGGSGPATGTDFREQWVAPLDANAHALKGSYYSATTVPTTAASGVAGHAAPVAYIDTKPYLYFKNNNTQVSKIRCQLDYISLRVTAVGAGGTLPRFWMALDAAGTNRYTSGGTEIAIKNPMNTDIVSPASAASIYHGAVVSPAASTSQRVIKTGQIRPVVPVIYDEVIFTFGRVGQQPPPSVLSGTLVATQTIACPPVVVGPQATFLLHLWRASQSGADSYEVDMGWVER